MLCCLKDALLEEWMEVGEELLAVDVGTTWVEGATGGVVENFKKIPKIILQIVDIQTTNHTYSRRIYPPLILRNVKFGKKYEF